MRRIKNLLKKGTSLMLTVAMLMGLCATGFAVEDNNDDGVINYVSLGDSMTNGFGLVGYEPDPANNMFGFEVDVEEAYPHLVADELDAKLTQLATSGIRAEDLYYLLNYGTEYAVEWDEYGDLFIPEKFAAKYTVAQAAVIFQNAVKNADVISIGMGSNNFATLLDMRLMNWMGRILGADSLFADQGYGGEFDFNELVSELNAEQKAQIAEIYASVEEMVKAAAADSGIPMNAPMAADGATVGEFAADIANALSYTTAGFVLGYKGVIDTIVRENSDAEIIIVGLTNWFRGMEFGMPVGDEMLVFPVGDVMEVVCDFAGSYMAALPAVYEVAAQINGTEMQPIYFADTNAAGVPDIELLIEQIVEASDVVDFDELNALEGEAQFAAAKAMAEQIDPSEVIPAGTTMLRLEEQLNAYLGNVASGLPANLQKELLDGLKKSMIASLHADVVNVEHFNVFSSMDNVMNAIMGAILPVMFEGEELSAFTSSEIGAALMCVPEVVTMSNLLFNFVVGSGVILHPSTNGHKVIANVVVDAYNNNYTATDKTMDDVMEGLNALAALIAEYYDEAYEFGYNYAKDNGYIDVAIEALTYAETELTAIEALVMEGEMSDAFRAELANEFATARDTIAQVKVLINEADVLDEATLTEALELLGMLQENLNNILALLNIAYEDISPVVMAEIKARVEALNAYVENEVIPAVEKAIREAYECAVAYLRDLVAQLEAAVEEMKAALIAHVDEKVAAAIACVEAAVAELKAAVEEQIGMTIEQFQTAVETAVKDLTTAIVELIHAAEQQGENWVEVVVAHFVEQVKAIYADATSGEYVKDSSSYYVAIGDGSIVGESYVGILAKELGVKSNNIGVDGLTIADCAAVLGANAADIFAADLITIGFSNNTMIDYMVAQMKACLLGNPAAEYDWSKYVTAEGTAYVEQALVELRAELTAMGLEPISFGSKQIDTIEVLMVAIEAYAYSYVGYMFSYPELIKGIREINSDALIVSVGMNNALANVAFNLDGAEFAIGEYVQYLIDAANAEALAFAALTGETVFVDAPAVETIAEAKGTAIESLEDFLFAVVLSDKATAEFYASANGHAYIAEQILNALTVKSDAINVKKGDVNGDGVVNGRDTIIISTAIANRATDEFTAEQFAAADVNGDGSVNGRDTIIISTAIANRTTDEL